MALYWSKQLEFLFAPGAVLPGALQVALGPSSVEPAPDGPPERRGTGITSVSGSLRIVVWEAQSLYDGTVRSTPSLYQAVIQLPDDGTLVAPIDIPCVLPVQLPVTVTVRPIRTPAIALANVREHVLLTAWEDQGASAFAYGGTLWQQIPVGGQILVPDWAGAVSILDAAHITTPGAAVVCSWLDAIAAVVGTCTGTYQPRPRRAVVLRNDHGQNAANVIFHWTGP